MSNYDVGMVFKAIDEFSPALKKMQEAMANFEKQTEKNSDKLKKFSQSVEKTGKFMMKALVMPLAAAAGYAIKNAEQFERMQIRLESVAGSATNAAKITESIKKMSMATGLSPTNLGDTATRLLAAGYGMDQINDKLQQMSQFAVVSGKDVNEIAAGFIRMKTLGVAQPRLMAKMSQEGIPLIKAFKEYYHLSDKAWKAMASKKIDFKLMEPVLDSMTKKGSAFSDAYQKMLRTPDVSIQRMHQSVRVISASFGEALLHIFGVKDGLKGVADYLEEIAPKVQEWMENNGDMIKMIAYIALIGTGLISVCAAINSVTKAVGTMRVVWLTLAANPAILAFIASIVAMTKLILVLRGFSFKELGKELSQVGSLMKTGNYGAIKKGVMGGLNSAVDSADLANAPSLLFGGNKQQTSTSQAVDVTLKSNQASIPITLSGQKVGVADFNLGLTNYATT